jgi:hypothetical protein
MKRDLEDPRHVEWREKVFKRDKYRCKACGRKTKYPNAHHLDGYNWFPYGRYEVSNGITLCSGRNGCHNRFHNEYGRGNNTRGQFDEFLRNNFQKTLRQIQR